MRYTRVSAGCFARFLVKAWNVRKGDTTVGEMLDPNAVNASHYEDAKCFLANDCQSGFVIRNGDLQTVWSILKGRGDQIVTNAIRQGAITLDCFDGYLPTLYAKYGFKEIKREANWNEGGPDVVYMAR